MSTPTPEELANDIEALLLKFCPGGRTQEAGVALLALARSAVAAEREAIAAHFEREANANFDFLGKDVAAYVRARGEET